MPPRSGVAFCSAPLSGHDPLEAQLELQSVPRGRFQGRVVARRMVFQRTDRRRPIPNPQVFDQIPREVGMEIECHGLLLPLPPTLRREVPRPVTEVTDHEQSVTMMSLAELYELRHQLS